MGTGFWGLRQENYCDSIRRIITEGGDADTNAAVAGALLGVWLGYNRLPQDLIQQLKFKGWLDNLGDQLISSINV